MITGLVPARFLTLIAHFILILAIFWSRDENVRAGLPLRFTANQYETKDIQFTVALSLTVICFAVELFGFFAGISTFIALSATALHVSACVALAFFVWDIWDCDLYWYIFGFCSALPAVLELFVIVVVLLLKKTV